MIGVLASAASVFVASSTAYSPCSSPNPRMADGTPVTSKQARTAVASNRHPLGTRIRLIGATFHGRRTFIVRDRGSRIMQLDFFTRDCRAAVRWGRVRVRYRVVSG